MLEREVGDQVGIFAVVDSTSMLGDDGGEGRLEAEVSEEEEEEEEEDGKGWVWLVMDSLTLSFRRPSI